MVGIRWEMRQKKLFWIEIISKVPSFKFQALQGFWLLTPMCNKWFVCFVPWIWMILSLFSMTKMMTTTPLTFSYDWSMLNANEKKVCIWDCEKKVLSTVPENGLSSST